MMGITTTKRVVLSLLLAGHSRLHVQASLGQLSKLALSVGSHSWQAMRPPSSRPPLTLLQQKLVEQAGSPSAPDTGEHAAGS